MATQLVAIVDDDEAVRLSTSNLLSRAGYEVRSYESGNGFISAGEIEAVSCVLLDMQMPEGNGLEVLRALAARNAPPPVIVITAHGDVAMAVEAMKLGAYDFLEKPYEGTLLLDRIEAALKSRASAIGENSSGVEAKALVASLSQRQREVLQGIVRGLQNKIIAFELGLSVRTVEAYRAQVLQRLGCRGTAGAVRMAIAAGLLDAPAAVSK